MTVYTDLPPSCNRTTFIPSLLPGMELVVQKALLEKARFIVPKKHQSMEFIPHQRQMSNDSIIFKELDGISGILLGQVRPTKKQQPNFFIDPSDCPVRRPSRLWAHVSRVTTWTSRSVHSRRTGLQLICFGGPRPPCFD